MDKNKEKIDELIKKSLNDEEARFYDQLEEPNLIGKLEGVFKGKLGWLALLMNIIHLALFVLFIYCLVQVFDTDDTNMLIKWASGGFLCMIAMGMLKLFIWMQMDKNDILRELKRLELQLAALSGKEGI